ncbi:hypothetical protein MBLNU13_g00421t2 [Cladosporium sp. NU13]
MTSTTFPVHDDAPTQAINATFGDSNCGFQAGMIDGNVNIGFHRHDAPERPETPPVPASTILPFDRDPDYVERGSLLEEIGAKLARPAARVALVGLGGVGKTQLAIEYAHRQKLQSPKTWVLWLYASNEARFEQSVRDILDQLKVPNRHDPKSNIFQLLRGILCNTTKGPWLLIIDNADNARVLLGSSCAGRADKSAVNAPPTEARLDYIPRCDHGRVLITSRSRDAARELVDWKDIVAVGPMNTEQAVALLEKKLDREYEVQNVVVLAKALDFMPLALAQAAAYICQRAGRCSVQEYVEKLGQYDRSEASVLDLDERDLRRDREASNSIMLTWQISFNHIREVRPSASDLLSLMCFFDRHAIPEALLQERGSGQAEGEKEGSAGNSGDSERGGEDAGTSKPSERNAAIPGDKVEEYELDIVVLRNYSLISSTTDKAVFEMHRLVQDAIRKWLRAVKQLDRWASQFVSNLGKVFPTSDIGNWAICQSLFPHTMEALHVKSTDRETSLQLATLLLRSGNYASAVGIYVDAENMQKRSLEVRNEMLGEGHPDTLVSIGNLANTYRQQGRLDEAEKLEVEVLEKKREQGRLDEAEKLEVEVLEKKREVLGEGHPDKPTSVNIPGPIPKDSSQRRWVFRIVLCCILAELAHCIY